jgi:hypothetical protein
MLMTPCFPSQCWLPLIHSPNAGDPLLPSPNANDPCLLSQCWRPLIHTPHAGDPCYPPQMLMTPASLLNADDPCYPLQMLTTPASFIAVRAATPSCPLHQSASIFVEDFFVFSRREKLCKNVRDILFLACMAPRAMASSCIRAATGIWEDGSLWHAVHGI